MRNVRLTRHVSHKRMCASGLRVRLLVVAGTKTRALSADSPRGQAFPAQFFERLLRLLQTLLAHALEDLWGFGELDLRVVNDLPAVAPGIEEVKAPARKDLHPHLLERPPNHPPVVHHHPDVPVFVWRTVLAFGERDELISCVYERHPGSASPQLDLEEVSVERERLLYIPDLDGDMIEPDELRAVGHHAIIYSSGSSRYPANVVGAPRNGGDVWYLRVWVTDPLTSSSSGFAASKPGASFRAKDLLPGTIAFHRFTLDLPPSMLTVRQWASLFDLRVRMVPQDQWPYAKQHARRVRRH